MGYPQDKGVPLGREKVKYSISHSRFFNNIQKYTYDANFNRIRLEIKDLPLSPLRGTLRGKGYPWRRSIGKKFPILLKILQ